MLARTAADREAVDRGHRRHAVAELWTPAGMSAMVDISGGSLTFTRTAADGQRRGSMTVAGYDWWPLLDPTANGWVRIWVDVDDAPFDLGQFPITQTRVTRPGGSIDVGLGDWSYRSARTQVEQAEVITGTLSAAVASKLTGAMGVPVTVTRDDTAGAAVASPYDIRLGANIWSELFRAANDLGCVLVHTSRTTAAIVNYDTATEVVEDLDGTINKAVSGVDAGAAVNRVVVSSDGTDGAVYRAERTLTTGPYAYGGPFGKSALVDTSTVKAPTQALVDAAADRLAARQFGVVRSLDLDIVAMPWLQVGDIITATTAIGTERAMIESLTMPLAAGTMNVKTRDRSDVTGAPGA